MEADPSKLSARAIRGREPCPEIERVWKQNFSVYGARKVWGQLQREGFGVARCTVERLVQVSNSLRSDLALDALEFEDMWTQLGRVRTPDDFSLVAKKQVGMRSRFAAAPGPMIANYYSGFPGRRSPSVPRSRRMRSSLRSSPEVGFPATAVRCAVG